MDRSFLIRPIQPSDNAAIAGIIRQSLEEFGAAKPGTVYFDPTTDHLYELFRDTPGSAYFILEENGQVSGGAGIYPTEGLPAGTCELVKMYLRKSTRNKGLGRKMIAHCIDTALTMGYNRIYLETMPELQKAVAVYERFGFQYLSGPMGQSGHTGCDIWMLLSLQPA
ncbi:MAG TPA: GNAT family N-acetyltransferase [Sediminibacterium sp.]|nr:GNAT family N-acetyltransferase [Sediminibacterium sp.]